MGFSSDLWDSFEAIYARVREGKVFTTKTEEFFKKRAEIERDYAKKLQALVKTTEVERGTVNTAWTTIKNETENLGKKHAEIAEALQNQINDPLRNWLKENEKPRKLLREKANKLIKDLKAAEENCQKKKREYENLRKAQDKSQEDYEKATFNNAQSPAVEKLAKKVSADTKSAEAGDSKYQEAVKQLQEAQVKNYDTDLPQTLDELEKMEEARIGVLKTCFESYTTIQKSLAPEIERIAENLRRDSINAKTDIADFVREKKTGASKPPRVEYEPYDPATQTCKPGTPSSRAGAKGTTAATADKGLTAVQLAKMAQAQKPAAAATPAATATTTTAAAPKKTEELKKDASADKKDNATNATPNPNANAAYPGLPAGVTPLGVAKALFDYAATEDGELTFKGNDLITILQKDPSGWWQGELNGKIGVFPSVDWVEEVAIETKFPKVAAATTATAGAAAAPKSAASTSKREPEKIVEKKPEPMPEPMPPPPPVPTGPPPMPTGAEKAKKERVKALYDYPAENEFEISITEGDSLIVDHMDDDGWYSGWNERTAAFGRFPSNYVEKV